MELTFEEQKFPNTTTTKANMNYKCMKEKMADYIDSSGGTIDAADVIQT